MRHLHAFTREVDLTPEEWLEGIKFLTAVGQKCTLVRQEFGDPAAPMQGMPSIWFDFRLAQTEHASMGRVGADPSKIVRVGA